MRTGNLKCDKTGGVCASEGAHRKDSAILNMPFEQLVDKHPHFIKDLTAAHAELSTSTGQVPTPKALAKALVRDSEYNPVAAKLLVRSHPGTKAVRKVVVREVPDRVVPPALDETRARARASKLMAKASKLTAKALAVLKPYQPERTPPNELPTYMVVDPAFVPAFVNQEIHKSLMIDGKEIPIREWFPKKSNAESKSSVPREGLDDEERKRKKSKKKKKKKSTGESKPPGDTTDTGKGQDDQERKAKKRKKNHVIPSDSNNEESKSTRSSNSDTTDSNSDVTQPHTVTDVQTHFCCCYEAIPEGSDALPRNACYACYQTVHTSAICTNSIPVYNKEGEYICIWCSKKQSFQAQQTNLLSC